MLSRAADLAGNLPRVGLGGWAWRMNALRQVRETFNELCDFLGAAVVTPDPAAQDSRHTGKHCWAGGGTDTYVQVYVWCASSGYLHVSGTALLLARPRSPPRFREFPHLQKRKSVACGASPTLTGGTNRPPAHWTSALRLPIGNAMTSNGACGCVVVLTTAVWLCRTV